MFAIPVDWGADTQKLQRLARRASEDGLFCGVGSLLRSAEVAGDVTRLHLNPSRT